LLLGVIGHSQADESFTPTTVIRPCLYHAGAVVLELVQPAVAGRHGRGDGLSRARGRTERLSGFSHEEEVGEFGFE
jgi:hypothetical protein